MEDFKNINNSTSILKNSTTLSNNVNRSLFNETSEDSIISFEVELTLTAIASTAGLFGIWMNILTLITLGKEKDKTSTVILFIGLNVSDLIYLINEVIFQIIEILPLRGNECNKIFYEFILPASCVYFVLKESMGILVFVMSTERVFAVRKPFEFRSTWTPRIGIVLAILPVPICSVIMGTLFLLEWYEIAIICDQSILFLSACCVVVANVVTVRSLKQNNVLALMGQSAEGLASEKKTTKNLLVISILFVGSVLFSIVSNVMLIIEGPGPDRMTLWVLLTYIANIIAGVFFSTFNGFIFVVFNKHYRATFLQILCCKPRNLN